MVSTVVALGAVGVAVAIAGSSGRFVTVSSGKLGGTSWIVGMARIHGERCYGTVVLRNGWESDGKVCGNEGPPQGDWRRVTGDSGEGEEASIELDLTSKRVRTLNLLVGHPGSTRKPTWQRLHTHALNAKQAAVSHMPRDFRFAVLSDRGELCVEAVEAFDRQGNQLLDESVPCEY